MTYLWAGMLLAGITYGVFTGNPEILTKVLIESTKEAVALCISMLGITAFWTGIMKIAENSGIVVLLAKKARPIINFLFPELNNKEGERARHFISVNFFSNILGLGWAATASGLKAMKELNQIKKNHDEKYGIIEEKRTATRAMCTFLIINVSSLQLLPINIIAYRAQYGSVAPAMIIGPAILATLASTIAGIIFCLIERKIR